MKTIILGAAGLLLSTTALAGVVTSKDMNDEAAAAPVAAKDADSLDGSLIANAITIDWPTKASDDDKSNDPTKVIEASAKAMPETPAAETPSTAEMSAAIDPKADELHGGMGGPDEPVATAAAMPVRTETSWPACAPGPGDDNCIQLYEPGVAESYAAWQGANVPGAEQTAMGGPEEPIEGADAVPAAATSYPVCRSRADDRCIQPGEHETLAGVDDGSERLAMGGPEEPVEGAELAAYEPIPEDAVMPATDEEADKDSPDTMAI